MNSIQLMYTVVENEVVKDLKRYVIYGVENARRIDKLYPYSLGVIVLRRTSVEYDVDFDYLKEKIKTVKKVMEDGDLRPILDVEFIIGIVLAYRLLHDYKVLSREEIKVIKDLLSIIGSRKWLNSIDLMAFTCFALQDIKEFEDVLNDVASTLAPKYTTIKLSEKRELIVPIVFGLSFIPSKAQFLKGLESVYEDLVREGMLSARDLAKLGIGLYNLMKLGIYSQEALLFRIVEKLENTLRDELRNKISYNIQRGIREATCLVLAGFNEREANEMLRRYSSDIADFIEIRGQKVILNKIPQPTHIPALDVETYALALWFLHLMDREELYVLDRENFKLAENGVKLYQSSYIPIESKWAMIVKWISILLAFSLTLLIAWQLLGGQISALIEALRIASGSPDPWRILNMFLSYSTPPLVITLLLLMLSITYTRVLDIVLSKGRIDKVTLIMQVPLVNRIYRLLKGES